uniref:SH3 domain-containing protein n=2 Tax=Leptobrachium leishanense TaxID=445787 RepID=A0A8C5P688_9ANUR
MSLSQSKHYEPPCEMQDQVCTDSQCYKGILGKPCIERLQKPDSPKAAVTIFLVMAETEDFKSIRSRFQSEIENQKVTKPVPVLKPTIPVRPNLGPSTDRFFKRPIPKALSSPELPALPIRNHLKNAGNQSFTSRTSCKTHISTKEKNDTDNVINKPALPPKPLVKKDSADFMKTNIVLDILSQPLTSKPPADDKRRSVPKLNHLPSVTVLGPKPKKPARPPFVNLDKFKNSTDSDIYVVMRGSAECLRHSSSQPNLVAFSPSFNFSTPSGPATFRLPRSHSQATLGLRSTQQATPREDEEIYENILHFHTDKEKSISLQNFVIPETSGPEEIYDDVEAKSEEKRKLSLQNSSSSDLNVLITNWRNDTNLKKMEKLETEFRKKFQFTGEIKVATRMMVDPNAIIHKPGDKDLPYTRGEIIDVIQFTSAEKILCRNFEGKFGYLPRNAVLNLENTASGKNDKTEDIYDDTELISSTFPAMPSKPRFQHSYVTRMLQRNPDKRSSSQKAADIQQKEYLKKCKNEAKELKELKKKFKIEGDINVLTRMMVVPSAGNKRGGGKELPISKGEILEVIQFTNQEKILCRNSKGKYGYVKRKYVLQAEKEVYDDVASIKSAMTNLRR